MPASNQATSSYPVLPPDLMKDGLIERLLAIPEALHPSGKQRYVRTYGPTVFQDWLPWGRENVGER